MTNNRTRFKAQVLKRKKVKFYFIFKLREVSTFLWNARLTIWLWFMCLQNKLCKELKINTVLSEKCSAKKLKTECLFSLLTWLLQFCKLCSPNPFNGMTTETLGNFIWAECSRSLISWQINAKLLPLSMFSFIRLITLLL